jgi:hypothetical protein
MLTVVNLKVAMQLNSLARVAVMAFSRWLTGALLVLSCEACWAQDLIGQASVIDGDTVEIHGTRVRVFGIDAPESSQLCRDDDSLPYRCGAKAANELSALPATFDDGACRVFPRSDVTQGGSSRVG